MDTEMLETPQLDAEPIAHAIITDDDFEIQGSATGTISPKSEPMSPTFSNPPASPIPLPNWSTTMTPEPMESTPQAFPNQLASPTPHPNEPNTAFPEPIEFTPQASVPPDTSHQTVPPFASTTEGPALTSSLASEVISVTNPSLKRGFMDDTTMEGSEESEESLGCQPDLPVKVRIVLRENDDKRTTSSSDQEDRFAKYQESFRLILNEKYVLQEELQAVSVRLEQTTSLVEDLTKKVIEHDRVREALEQGIERIKEDAALSLGELETKLAEMTRHSQAVHAQSKATEERLTEEGLAHELASKTSEQETERIKEGAALRLKEHKIELAEITRHAEATQAKINVVEECVTGWKIRCRGIESERDQVRANLAELHQSRPTQEQLNVAETSVREWKDQCEQMEFKLYQTTEASESLLRANREQAQLIEEQMRQLRRATATAEKDQEDLKRHIEVIRDERDRATADLNIQRDAHQKDLLAQEQKHEARIGEMNDASDITTGGLHAAYDASAREAEILKNQIESIQRELTQAIQSRTEQEADHRQSMLDMTKTHEGQIVSLKQLYSELQTAHSASTEATVSSAVAAANQSRKDAVDEASTLRKNLEDIELQHNQTKLAQKQQQEENQQTLLDMTKNYEAQIADMRETHTKSKVDLQNSNRSSIDEAVQKERDQSVQALKQREHAYEQLSLDIARKQDQHKEELAAQREAYEQLSLDIARKQDQHKEELAALQEAHTKEKAETVDANERAFSDWLAERVPEIRREEQEKTKALLDEAVERLSNKAEKTHQEMQQKVAEITNKSNLDRQKAEELEAEVARLQTKRYSNHAQNLESGVNGAQPRSSRNNTGDVDMETLSDKARGKRPESLDYLTTRGSKSFLKRQPRLFSTNSNRYQSTEAPAREGTPLGDYLRARAQPTTTETSESIAPPIRFPRPYGADTPLADRLHMPSPPTLPRSRSQSPFISRRPSVSASIHSISSTFGFPLRGESPIAPLFSGSDSVPGGTSGRPPTPGPSNLNTSNTHTSFTPNGAGVESLRDVLQDFASGITSDLDKLRGELQKAQELFSSRQQMTPRKTNHGEFKTKTPSRPRTTARTEMMASVRLEMNALLDIKSDVDIARVVQATPVVGPEEVAEFRDGAGDPPSLKPLRPFWDVIPSTWNHHLAHAFAIDFMEAYGEDLITTQKEVAEFFLQRLETLRKQIHKLIPIQEGESAEEITARVAQQEDIRRAIVRRRGRVERRFEARLKICEEGTNNANQDSALAWQILFSLVDTLGKDGQSSDETDGDNHAVHIKDWRSDDVKRLLLYIDANRKTTNATGTRIGGVRAFIRVRRAYGPLSARQAVAGLPRNFYNTLWYDGLSRIQQLQLAAIDNIQFPHVDDL